MRSARSCKAIAPKWHCGRHIGDVGLHIMSGRAGSISAGLLHRFSTAASRIRRLRVSPPPEHFYRAFTT